MTTRDFVKYFKDFYGPNGLYPFDFKIRDTDIVLCVRIRGKNYAGDSIDREAIRDMILVANNRAGGAFKGAI